MGSAARQTSHQHQLLFRRPQHSPPRDSVKTPGGVHGWSERPGSAPPAVSQLNVGDRVLAQVLEGWRCLAQTIDIKFMQVEWRGGNRLPPCGQLAVELLEPGTVTLAFEVERFGPAGLAVRAYRVPGALARHPGRSKLPRAKATAPSAVNIPSRLSPTIFQTSSSRRRWALFRYGRHSLHCAEWRSCQTRSGRLRSHRCYLLGMPVSYIQGERQLDDQIPC